MVGAYLRSFSALVFGALLAGSAHAALTVTPITWNVVGLDSNSPTTGPFRFPVAARVCAVGAPSNGPVNAAFALQAAGPNSGTNNGAAGCTGGVACITIRGGTLSSYALTTGALAAGSCADAYFEVEVFNADDSAFTRARNYTITATDGSGPVSTPQPRELYVERLISQNRNSVLDVSYSGAKAINDPFPTPVGPPPLMTSVSAGGSFGLAVGGIYDIRLDASTATQGYEQLETFANFSNAVFRILQVQSTYSANSSPFYGSPPGTSPATTSFLYANGCNWQLSPLLPNYLGCQGTGKSGGTISATYRIQVLAVPSGGASALNTLIYDYSGSSFHYNADTGVGGRTIVISNPATATFSKAFSPASILRNGTSRLTFTITNPNATAFSGYNFVDPLPAGVVVAATPNAFASPSCGSSPSPTWAPAPPPASQNLTFSNGTIAANSTCTIQVDVTGDTAGSYDNTTLNLFVGATNTNLTASATLTIGAPSTPSGGTCLGANVSLAEWRMNDTALNTPVTLNPNGGPPFSFKAANVNTAVASFPTPANAAINASDNAGSTASRSWSGTPWPVLGVTLNATTAPYFQIDVDTSKYINIQLAFRANLFNTGWASANDNVLEVFSAVNGAFSNLSPREMNRINIDKNGWAQPLPDPLVASASNSGATTSFRIMGKGIGGGGTAVIGLDNVIVSGCLPLNPLTVTKSFAPKIIGVGQPSVLTFVITNPNATAVSGVSLTDAVPAGLTIGTLTTPACGGTLSQTPAGTISLTGGSIGANTSCTYSAPVAATTAGLKQNVSNPVTSTQTGPNTGANGIARDDLLVIAPPTIVKSFTTKPILAGGTSGLVFTITNPNSGYTMQNVSFLDILPTLPAQMLFTTPAPTTSCTDGAVSLPLPTNTRINLQSATLLPGSSCTVTAFVTAPTGAARPTGLVYTNTSNPVTHLINSVQVGTNTATDTIPVWTPAPKVGLQKRISLSPTGPWAEFVSLAPGGSVYYQFTIENTGDVPLSRPAAGWITDALIPGGPFCNTGLTPLPLANINDTHIHECVVGPITANQVDLLNNATATGDPDNPASINGNEVTATNTAAYTTKRPDLLVTKTRILPLGRLNTEAATPVTYRITVTNQAPAATVNSTLAPIVVEDTLRSGITYTSFTSADLVQGTFWSCTLVQTVPDRVSCSFSGVLAPSPGPGHTTSFDITVQVAAGTPDVNNVAVAQFGGDPECNSAAETPITECKSRIAESSLNDYGDLPDAALGVAASSGGSIPNYRTTVADGGPIAKVVAGLFLGNNLPGISIDADLDGLNSNGNGDDTGDLSDDESGLESITRIPGAPSQGPVTALVRVTNTTGAPARICLFVDRNANGTFDDQAEIGTVAVPNGTTNALLSVVLPASTTITQPALTPGIGIRLRLARESDIGATCEFGEADGALSGFTYSNPAPGEVEDYYTGLTGTVPVTLSNVEVLESGSDLVVNFQTATEAGTLGFRVLADIGKGIQARVEIGAVASKVIDSLKEQAYSVRARNPGADQVWIEESSVDGKTELYGPYKVGSSVGEVGVAAPLKWAAVNAEQANFRAERATLLRVVNAKAAELRVSADAWVRVTHEQLMAAGVDLSGQALSNISVRTGSETMSARVSGGGGAKLFGAGSIIEFFAQAVKNSLYTNTAVYRIEAGRALSIGEIDARTTGVSVGSEVLAVADTLVLNKNTTYSFSSPLEDPWFNFRALRSGGSAVGVGSISFTLKDRVASFVEGDKPLDTNLGTEAIEVSFWGGLDYAGTTPDHHAVFKLNGVVLGSTRFDGFAARVERFAVPTGVLLDTTNTFTVELPSGTGYAADIVNVESVKVSYLRKLIPQTDRISVLLPATTAAGATKPDAADAAKASDGADKINASTFVVSGLSGAPVVAVLERAGVHSVLATDAISTGRLRIELAALAGDRLSVMPVENGVLPSAALALEDPIAGVDKASYLIISHPSFIANLSPLILAKQQQGFSVKVVDEEAIYRYYSAGVIDPAAIQLAIRRAQQNLGTTHVLLVGGDTYDYHNVLGINSVSFIPTNYRRTGPIIAFAPSDVVYADTDSNGVANLAIGRWPVRTNAELNALLGKTLSYQNTRKALFISDRSLNGISYANQAAPLANLLGQDWTTSQLSLDSYVAGQAATARADIIRNLEGGTSLLSYYGHSAPASWSREGLITASQVSSGLFNTVNQPFAAVQLGCWGTYFVEPTSTTVAHQMLLMQKGAAAVLGATSLTESNSDLALAQHLLPRLSSTTLGDALLQAQQAVATELPNAQDVILGGTLLGDPGLR